jgi:hypothetical protein
VTVPVPNKVEGLRDDSVRLRELIAQCVSLNTHDVSLLAKVAPEVWSYARSLAGEIGLEFRNPPTPGVCKKAGGECGCGGKC